MAVQRLYEAVGGMDACRKLSVAFYARAAQDPLLRPLFGSSFRCAIEAFGGFLIQFLGGPAEYAERRWWLSLRESHLRFKIGAKERNAWIKNMRKALNDAQIPEPAQNALLWFFEQSSAYLVNQGKAPKVENEPSMDRLRQEIARRWETQCSIDAAVVAVRNRDASRAIELAGGSAFEHDRAALLSLLELMSGSRDAVMLNYVRKRLLMDPDLALERYTGGRTLLHGAAGAGGLLTLRLLLELGSDPNAIDKGGHTPLYCAGNECTAETGAAIVRTLVEYGANVNAHDGMKQCTALHMAARRGNLQVAEALIDCGADLGARDTKGDTPLKRALNCRKAAVAALLSARSK